MAKKNGKKKALSPVVFSGVRSIRTAQFFLIDEVLNNLKADTFITGGAYGVDMYTCINAVRSFPRARHIVVVPWGYALNDVHIAWCLACREEGINIEVLDMPKPKRKDQHPNLIRNEYMLDLAIALNESKKRPRLIAFPGGSDEVLRSGTWATIRRARDRDFDIQIHPLVSAPGMLIGGLIES